MQADVLQLVVTRRVLHMKTGLGRGVRRRLETEGTTCFGHGVARASCTEPARPSHVIVCRSTLCSGSIVPSHREGSIFFRFEDVIIVCFVSRASDGT